MVDKKTKKRLLENTQFNQNQPIAKLPFVLWKYIASNWLTVESIINSSKTCKMLQHIMLEKKFEHRLFGNKEINLLNFIKNPLLDYTKKLRTEIFPWDNDACWYDRWGYVNIGNGKIAEACGYDIKIFQPGNKESIRLLKGHTDPIHAIIKLSNDKIATGSNDRTIKIWDINDGKCLRTLKGHKHYINCLANIGNGLIASGTRFYHPAYLSIPFKKQSIKIWNTNTGKCIKTIKAHYCNIKFLLYLGNQYLVSCGFTTRYRESDTIKIWNIDTGKCIKKFEYAQTLEAVKLDKKHIAVRHWYHDSIFSIIDISKGKCVNQFTIPRMKQEVSISSLPGGHLGILETDHKITMIKFSLLEPKMAIDIDKRGRLREFSLSRKVDGNFDVSRLQP